MHERREYHTHGETITSPVRSTETLVGLRLSVRFNDFKRTLERLLLRRRDSFARFEGVFEGCRVGVVD